MKGFGHITWGCSAYVIIISIMTIIMLPIEHTGYMWASIGLGIGALIVQNWEAQWDRAYKQTKAKTDPKKKAFYRKLYKSARLVIMTMLTFGVMILCFFHIGLMYNGLPNFHFSLIFSGYFVAILGAYLPDIDLNIDGVEGHRNPLTHSATIGSVMAFSMIFFLDGDFLIICFIPFALCVGLMMHLYCDIIPEGSNGWQAIKSLFDWSETPGDIRGIREGCEQPYLIFNGAIASFFAIFCILRSMSERIAFPAVWGMNGANFTPVSTPLFIIGILLVLAPFIMQFIFSDQRKKKRTATKK